MKPHLNLAISAVLGLAAAGAVSTDAFAATLYVDQQLGNDDAGLNCEVDPCKSIATALEESDSGDTIKVYPGTYTEYDLDITYEITIEGYDPSDPPTIDANEEGRHFNVATDDPFDLVKIRDVSLINGDAGSESGGSIMVTSGRLRLVNATVRGNSSGSTGGAIECNWDNCQELIVRGSVLEDNTAQGDGGAIKTYAPTVIRSSAFFDNGSGSSGGAISISEWIWAQHLDISDTEFENNEAEDAGGAIYSGNSPVTIEKSALIGNVANGVDWPSGGSAIYFAANGAEELVMTNSTLARNDTENAGAVYMGSGTVGKWANMSWVANTSFENGRHVYAEENTTITVLNSLFYTAFADVGLTDACVTADPTNLIGGENNLWERGAECYEDTSYAGELTEDSLSRLGYHGGSTRSYLLKSNSNALGGGVNECPHPGTGVPLADDQRGVERPRGLVCDIGATEQGGFVNPLDDVPSDFPVDF